MSRRVWRRVLPLRSSLRITTLAATLVLLGAVFLGSARTPSASAQCFGCFGNGFNNGFGLNNALGFSGFNNGFGVNNALGFSGLNTGFGFSNGLGLNYNLLYGGTLASLAYSNPGLGYLPSYATTASSMYSPPRSYVPVSGQYCTDKTGGQVWIPTGSPTDGLNCGGSSTTSSSSSPSASASSSPASSPSPSPSPSSSYR
jgi:hypothetical protein